jgi:hypothetical protein
MEESVAILTAVGKWVERNGGTTYDSEKCRPRSSEFATFSRKSDTLYMHVRFWPGSTVALGGLTNQVESARLLAGNKEIKFDQDEVLRPLYRPTGESAGRSADDNRHRMRRRAAPAHMFNSPRAPASRSGNFGVADGQSFRAKLRYNPGPARH